MVPLKIVSNVLRFKPALNLKRVLADLNRGSNSLNSIFDHTKKKLLVSLLQPFAQDKILWLNVRIYLILRISARIYLILSISARIYLILSISARIYLILSISARIYLI